LKRTQGNKATRSSHSLVSPFLDPPTY